MSSSNDADKIAPDSVIKAEPILKSSLSTVGHGILLTRELIESSIIETLQLNQENGDSQDEDNDVDCNSTISKDKNEKRDASPMSSEGNGPEIVLQKIKAVKKKKDHKKKSSKSTKDKKKSKEKGVHKSKKRDKKDPSRKKSESASVSPVKTKTKGSTPKQYKTKSSSKSPNRTTVSKRRSPISRRRSRSKSRDPVTPKRRRSVTKSRSRDRINKRGSVSKNRSRSISKRRRSVSKHKSKSHSRERVTPKRRRSATKSKSRDRINKRRSVSKHKSRSHSHERVTSKRRTSVSKNRSVSRNRSASRRRRSVSNKKSRSNSRDQVTSKRRRSGSRNRSKSRSADRRKRRSVSPKARKRSPSPLRSRHRRSPSPVSTRYRGRRSRSRSRGRGRRSRSRSYDRQRRKSRSVSKKRSRSRSRKRSKSRPRSPDMKIDKQQLRKIAIEKIIRDTGVVTADAQNATLNMTEVGKLYASGISLDEITEVCRIVAAEQQKLAQTAQDLPATDSPSDINSDGASKATKSLLHEPEVKNHPFKVSDPDPYPFLSRAAKQILSGSTTYSVDQLSLEFPVSAGVEHRENEEKSPEPPAPLKTISEMISEYQSKEETESSSTEVLAAPKSDEKVTPVSTATSSTMSTPVSVAKPIMGKMPPASVKQTSNQTSTGPKPFIGQMPCIVSSHTTSQLPVSSKVLTSDTTSIVKPATGPVKPISSQMEAAVTKAINSQLPTGQPKPVLPISVPKAVVNLMASSKSTAQDQAAPSATADKSKLVTIPIPQADKSPNVPPPDPKSIPIPPTPPPSSVPLPKSKPPPPIAKPPPPNNPPSAAAVSVSLSAIPLPNAPTTTSTPATTQSTYPPYYPPYTAPSSYDTPYAAYTPGYEATSNPYTSYPAHPPDPSYCSVSGDPYASHANGSTYPYTSQKSDVVYAPDSTYGYSTRDSTSHIPPLSTVGTFHYNAQGNEVAYPPDNSESFYPYDGQKSSSYDTTDPSYQYSEQEAGGYNTNDACYQYNMQRSTTYESTSYLPDSTSSAYTGTSEPPKKRPSRFSSTPVTAESISGVGSSSQQTASLMKLPFGEMDSSSKQAGLLDHPIYVPPSISGSGSVGSSGLGPANKMALPASEKPGLLGPAPPIISLNDLSSNKRHMETLLNMPGFLKQVAETKAVSKLIAGKFTGQPMLKPMTIEQHNSGYQAWAKKDFFTSAKAVSEGKGMSLLKKMGWKEGEGLGRTKVGVLEPLAVDFKTDRRGLASTGETASKKGLTVNKAVHQIKASVVDISSGKHPISALMEYCLKRKYSHPQFTSVKETGPSHSKQFLISVIVNGYEYTPLTPSRNKKDAKTAAAQCALEEMGLVLKNPIKPSI